MRPSSNNSSNNKKNGSVSVSASPAAARDLENLRKHCPTATVCERERFLRAKDGNYEKALEQLRAYLDFRKEHGLDDVYHCSTRMIALSSPFCNKDSYIDNDNPTLDDNEEEKEEIGTEIWHSCASDEECLDELDWRFASQAALSHEQMSGTKKLQSNSASKITTTTLPVLARILPPTKESGGTTPLDQSGHRILQFLPAQMDLSKASETAFALSIALYLERKLDRNSSEKVTVAIDVRGGVGWANPKPQKLLPFIKQVAALLEQNFPERLAACVVFPVPAAATLLWRMIRVFLDPHTAQKIHLVRGDSRTEAPPPFCAMDDHISRSVLQSMEEFRCKSFGEEHYRSAAASKQLSPGKNEQQRVKKQQGRLIVATIE